MLPKIYIIFSLVTRRENFFPTRRAPIVGV